MYFSNSFNFATYSIMRNCGSFSNKNMRLSIKLDEFDTKICSSISIKVSVFVGFNSADGTQIDSKSKMAIF